jgi:hypothetical protein
MKTNLKEVIIAAKCRKGKAEAITAKGAYWLACPPIRTRAFGGDGIGQSSADCSFHLELRHYRDGKVRAVLVANSWHQNHGTSTEEKDFWLADQYATVEDVIIYLRLVELWDKEGISDYHLEGITAALTALGLPEYPIPSPDDEEPAA